MQGNLGMSQSGGLVRTISATEAKAKLSGLINWAVKNQEEVVVQSRGNPKAVIMAYDAYEQMKLYREQARRRVALAKLEALADEVRGRNQDLTEEKAQELVDRFAEEVVEEMVGEGKIKYKRE